MKAKLFQIYKLYQKLRILRKQDQNQKQSKKKNQKLKVWMPPPVHRNRISDYEMINQDPSLKNYEWHIRKRNDIIKKYYMIQNIMNNIS